MYTGLLKTKLIILKTKNMKVFKNFQKAINYKKYDIMILSNPTSEHIKYAIEGIKKKSIFILRNLYQIL